MAARSSRNAIDPRPHAMIDSGTAGTILPTEEPSPMWGSVVLVPAVAIVAVPPITVVDVSAIVVAPVNGNAVVSTIVVSPVS
jgi:hypothetical protein